MEIKFGVRAHQSVQLYMGRESRTNVSAVTGHPELVTRFNESSCPLLQKDSQILLFSS